jgi:phospholipid-translocating ATPase
MIQEADVGVGILGKEGNQAAAASDFYFSQFRFLDRLLLHHGRWAYYRIDYFFVYYNYKNVFITAILFVYLAYCGWSGANILATLYLTAYNSLLSVSMTLYYGVWEQDINCDMYPPARPMMPIFYREFKKMGLFSYSRYILWSLTGLFSGIFVFFVTIYGLSSLTSGDNSGRVPDRRAIASNLSVSTLLIVTLVIYFDTYNFTIWTWINLLITGIFVCFLYYIVENFSRLSTNFRAYGDNFKLKYWMVILLNTAFIYGLRVAYTTVRFCCFPNLVMQWMVKRNHDYKAVGLMQRPNPFIQAPYGLPAMYSPFPSSTYLIPSGSLLAPPVSNNRHNTTPIPNSFIGNLPTI